MEGLKRQAVNFQLGKQTLSVLTQFKLPCKKTLTSIGKVLWAQIKIVRSLSTNEIRKTYIKYRVGVDKWCLNETDQQVFYVIFSKVID